MNTLGLGIACVACLLILGATGITLLIYYIPHQEAAYDRILHIITALRYGKLIRNLHFLAANGLLILGILHLSRVFFMGSYRSRFLNWTFGLLLLALIFGSNYTGYLLPWDQTSYWAIQVGSNLASYFPWIGPAAKNFLLGGAEIGHDTLLRSFALHVAVLPLVWSILVSLHVWRIRRDGGLAAPDDDHADRLPASPWLFRGEIAIALLTFSVLLGLSLFITTPLAGRADPLHPPNPAKAPWYFVGIQEMVSHSVALGGIVIPLVIALFFFLAPVLDRTKKPGGIWFSRERLGVNVVFALILLSQIGMIVIGQWFRTKNWVFKMPW